MKYITSLILVLALVLSTNVQAKQHKFLVVEDGPVIMKTLLMKYMDRGFDCTKEMFMLKCFNDSTEKFVEITIIGRDKGYLSTVYLKTNIKDVESEHILIIDPGTYE